jgi:uncharacterized protein YxjI
MLKLKSRFCITKNNKQILKVMKKVLFKITIKSRDDFRDGKEVLLEVHYESDDSAYIEAVGPSYYRIHAPKEYLIISPEKVSKLVAIDRSTNKVDELVIMRIGYGRADNIDRIKVEVIKITEE